MRKIIFTAVNILLFTLSISANAEDYINKQIPFAEFLTPPPAVDSLEWKNDIETVIHAQNNSTNVQKEQVLAEEHVKEKIVTGIIGPDFTRQNYPQTFAMLSKLGSECHHKVQDAKKYWNTSRPFEKDKRIIPLVKSPGNGAYPSGHTACTRVWAEILGQLLPEQRETLRRRAAEIAWNRVIAGVHYPHDLKGGEQLAMLLIGAFERSTLFHVDFDRAKAEISKKKQ